MGLRPAPRMDENPIPLPGQGRPGGDSVVGLLFSERITEEEAGGEDWLNSLLTPSVDYYADRPPV